MNAARLWLVVSLVSLASAAPALRGRAERLQPAPPGVAERKPSWDIAAPYGPTRTLEFETSEGTWMNVDVSPDGRTIVFDLMGDIYTMPIEGSGASPARRLTSGPAFDMQPRFSPDGRRIAFSSDRDGLWNIWVMDTDGSNARQVSSERRWFVNSPTWSPDGAYIYARRHFVRERSLGAGEIWMYHAGTTSEGLQVTEKTSWQKDAGEPAVSPDGRYLYYSKDVTPGQTFEYNKDPHGVIYAIVRRDLTTGRERTLVQRPGGSVAPRPSPDGRRLAFVRRVGTGSVLFLRDLRTGEEQPIFDRLDKDLQEAWAIHGVYAQYGWTPDSRHIVIWGEGKIWKVDVEARKGEIVPFTARVETRIHEPLRFPQEVHPDEFPVRMLRDVTTSPDGRLVAYGALGRIYVKRLPDGPPQRLTAPASTTDDGARAFGAPVPPAEGTGRDGSGPAGAAMAPVAGGAGTARGTDAARGATRLQEEGEDWLEFDPAFSPDGRWIAFVAWNDRRFGRVRVAPAAGGPARDVVSEPGHYVEPAFSPDGRRLVYRKTRGDQVRGPTHGEEPGIYVVQIDPPGEPRLVRETGTDPQFDHTGERIYFRDRRDDRFVLASVDLDGSDEVVHFRSENATEIVPSPDGRWVAFAERYKAYVAPFPRTGRPIDLGPSVKGYPVAQISRDAGMYLHWSGDSSRVYWALGPELFARDLASTFAFLREAEQRAPSTAAGAAQPPAEPEPRGVPIGFRVRSDRPSGAIALVGARIVTMAGGRAGEGGRGRQGLPDVIENGAIVIEGNRIAAVGPAGSVRVPAGARRIDARGRTIIPGLVDVHAHVGGESDGLLAQAAWPLVANLAYGVTTAHDPSNDTERVFSTAEMIRAGLKLGPRLFSTGTILYGAETPYKAVVETYEDALAHLRRMKAVGAFSVKSYNQQRRDARQMIVKAGREFGVMVVPEGGSLLYMNQTHVADGHTGVEHSLPVPRLYRDVVTLFAKSGAGYTPTLIVGYGGLSGEYYWYQHTDVWENARLLAFVPPDFVVPRSRRRTMAAEDDFNHVLIARGATQILRAGGLVQMGSHGQLQGLGAHWEIWMLAQGGMTPLEALRCATINGARYLGLDRDLGSLEPGKLADLVVLERNPLEDIRHTETVAMVMLNGRLYDAELNEIGGRPRPRFYWQR